jgi:hypothetical protein
MRPGYRLRQVVNVLNGSTLAGMAVAGLGEAGLHPAPDGLIVGSGYRLPVPTPSAFCLGNVLVTRLDHAAFTGNARLFAHEARHATQYACCGGLALLPMYGVAAAVSWALTGDTGARNVFERLAGLADGGYSERTLRPALRRAVRGGAWRSPRRQASGGGAGGGARRRAGLPLIGGLGWPGE